MRRAGGPLARSPISPRGICENPDPGQNGANQQLQAADPAGQMGGMQVSGEIVGSGLEFRFCPLCGSPLLRSARGSRRPTKESIEPGGGPCPDAADESAQPGSRPGLGAGKGSSQQAHCPQCGYVHYRNQIAVIAVILQSDGPHHPPPGVLIPPSAATHLLLVRRSGIYPGTWCIPCGYVEYDEEVRAAAEREMLEETGLLVETSAVFAVHSNFHNPVNHTSGVWFLARCVGGELIPGDDADRVGFFHLDAMPEPLAFPTDREVIARLKDEVDASPHPG